MFFKEDKGAALLTVMVMILIISTLGTAMLSLSSTEKKIAVNQYRTAQVFYRAESGVQYALGQLEQNSNWQGGTVDLFNDDNPLMINISGSPPLVTVKSTAKVINAQKTITVDVKLSSGTFGQALLAYGDGGSSEFGKDTYIEGDLIINGDVSFQGGSIVTGLAYVGGNLDADGSNVTIGDGGVNISVDAPQWEMLYTPQPGDRDFDSEETLANTVIAAEGNITFRKDAKLENVTLEAGGGISFSEDAELNNVIIKAGGDVSFKKEAMVSGSIYAAGNISFAKGLTSITDGASFNDSQTALFVLGENISFDKGEDDESFTKGIKGVIFADQHLEIGKDFLFEGSIAAGSISAEKNAYIIFDQDIVSQLPVAGGGSITILSWQELSS